MDTLLDALPARTCRRVHFHRFMLEIHDGLRRRREETDPLRRISQEISANTRVLGFDEFQVSDIGDAMILSGLLHTGYVIALSNAYAEGGWDAVDALLQAPPATTAEVLFGEPVDPVDLWTDPPFSPVIRDERIYARGASDDKGNLLIPILAAEAWLKANPDAWKPWLDGVTTRDGGDAVAAVTAELE